MQGENQTQPDAAGTSGGGLVPGSFLLSTGGGGRPSSGSAPRTEGCPGAAAGGGFGLWAKRLQQSVEVVADSLQPHGLQHARLPWPSLSPRDFSQVHVHSVGDVDTGEGCYFLFQRIFLTSGSNPGLLHCGWIL